MPTNLPPDYFKAEEQFRAATTTEEKIAWLETMYSLVPKHKGTDHLRADLRRKISRLKEGAKARKGAARQASPYHIDREGAGQVVVIGPANSGKSSLVAALTNAEPEVAPHPFSTWGPTPGMMSFENVQIQLVDTPPLDAGFLDPEMINLLRRADLLMLVVDLQAFPIEQIERCKEILRSHRIVAVDHPEEAEGMLRATLKPFLIVVNKTDDERRDADFDALCELMEGETCPLVPYSAVTGYHLDDLKRAIFERLDVIRVYARPPGKEPDFTAPFVLKAGSTVEDFAAKVHQDFLRNLKSARVWGSTAFEGQMVARDYVLQDGDVVELRTD